MPCSPVPASLLYPCDLTDAEWAHLAPLLPGASAARPTPPLGAPAARQRHLLRPAHRLCLALSAARVSALANGVYDIPPVAPGGGLAAGPRGLATECPRRAGRDPEPSAAIMDSQSVKTTEESG